MLVESFGDYAFVDCADDLFFDLSVFDDQEGRDAADVELCCRRSIRIDVELSDLDAAFVFLRNRINGGSESTARRAPGGPKIDQDRRAGFFNFGLEVGISYFYSVRAHWSSKTIYSSRKEAQMSIG